MAVMTSALQTVSPNRRRRVRHKIQTPAYATFTGESQGAMLDLHEIVDISEDGVAIQCHSPLEVENRVNLCLDLGRLRRPYLHHGPGCLVKRVRTRRAPFFRVVPRVHGAIARMAFRQRDGRSGQR